jgi:hypothetical protein
VIGDGSMTAGMAFEALNNAGVEEDVNLLVVLNDNDMSISPPVGALNRYLARLMSGQFYAAAKNVGKSVLPAPMLELAKKLEEHAKGMVVPATMFEEFGFNYIGPIDGHDLDSLIPTLENIKKLKGPQFLHVVTKKGQGYKLAEAEPILYHGTGKFNPSEGIKPATAPARSPTPRCSATGCATWRQRQAPGRHHAGDARRLGHGALPPAVPGALLRRRHRRAACGDLRRRPGDRRHEAGGGDLLDLPAARLRPADPRRGAAEPGRDLRAGPRRPGRRRRRDPRRQLRPGLPALHPEHGRDGAVGRERMPPDADHGLPLPGPGGGALSARRRRRRGDAAGADLDRDRQGRDQAPGQGRRHPGLRLDGRAEPEGRGES